MMSARVALRAAASFGLKPRKEVASFEHLRLLAALGASAAATAIYGSSSPAARCVEQDMSPVSWQKQAQAGDDGELYWQYHVPVLVPMQYTWDQTQLPQSPQFGTPQSSYSAAPTQSVPQSPFSMPQSPQFSTPVMPELEPPHSPLPALAKEECSVPVQVSLRGLPDTVCTNVAYVEAMLEQAGLEDAVLDIARASPGVVRLSLAGGAAAQRCIVHFDGCPWGPGGSPVTAFLTDSPSPRGHAAGGRWGGSGGSRRGSAEKGAKGKGKGRRSAEKGSPPNGGACERGAEWARKGVRDVPMTPPASPNARSSTDSPKSALGERPLALELGASPSGSGSPKKASLRWADFANDPEFDDAMCSTRDCPDALSFDTLTKEIDQFPFAGTLACE